MRNIPAQMVHKLYVALNLSVSAGAFSLRKTTVTGKERLRLMTALQESSIHCQNPHALYAVFLECISEDKATGQFLLSTQLVKEILVKYRPLELPHWLLGLAECQSELVPIVLSDDEYRNSLSKREFSYLCRNYSDIAAEVKTQKIPPPLSPTAVSTSNTNRPCYSPAEVA